MNNKKQKLELTWIGKDEQPRLEPRILIEDPERSFGDKNASNMLIYGDNLLALKALEQDFAGQIKCIYIDPPYNTGNAFEHYDDGLEHSIWLNLMKPRLDLLYRLLSPDGVMFVNIDETEHAYLKVMLDEIFGRKYFIGDLIWKKRNGKWSLHHRVYMPEGQVLRSILEHCGTNKTAGDEMQALFADKKAFDYPKPEALIQKLLDLTTNEGDLVLDSFLGSGTTAAVAHKMKRRWIGIELGEHCYTHCLPRLRKVVDGTDQGGISKAVNWEGGGGFKYYYLAPSLLKQDKYGNWIIDERYNADMLAAAMAKHEGFKYSPDEYIYWKQGRSTEKDYIFTTTNFITVEFLDKINEEMQPDESLLICCKSFSKACGNRYPNITVKKIPNLLLGRCEFGREDYSLNIVNMPVEENEQNQTTLNPSLTKGSPTTP
jgi:adenine-specific DNA-methyltransferase